MRTSSRMSPVLSGLLSDVVYKEETVEMSPEEASLLQEEIDNISKQIESDTTDLGLVSKSLNRVLELTEDMNTAIDTDVTDNHTASLLLSEFASIYKDTLGQEFTYSKNLSNNPLEVKQVLTAGLQSAGKFVETLKKIAKKIWESLKAAWKWLMSKLDKLVKFLAAKIGFSKNKKDKVKETIIAAEAMENAAKTIDIDNVNVEALEPNEKQALVNKFYSVTEAEFNNLKKRLGIKSNILMLQDGKRIIDYIVGINSSIESLGVLEWAKENYKTFRTVTIKNILLKKEVNIAMAKFFSLLDSMAASVSKQGSNVSFTLKDVKSINLLMESFTENIHRHPALEGGSEIDKMMFILFSQFEGESLYVSRSREEVERASRVYNKIGSILKYVNDNSEEMKNPDFEFNRDSILVTGEDMEVILSSFMETEEKSNIKVVANNELNISSGAIEFKTLSKYAYVFGDTKDIANRVVWEIPNEDEVLIASKDLGYFEKAAINKNFKINAEYYNSNLERSKKFPSDFREEEFTELKESFNSALVETERYLSVLYADEMSLVDRHPNVANNAFILVQNLNAMSPHHIIGRVNELATRFDNIFSDIDVVKIK